MNTTMASGKTASQVTSAIFVARRRWLAFLGGEREPGFEASEDAYVGLLFDELLGLVEPVVALFVPQYRPIKSQAFTGNHPTTGQKSRDAPKGGSMNEGEKTCT